MNLAEQLGPVPGDEAPTSPLSVFFEGIITALLQFTDRADNEANCRTSAYEAISTLAMYSANVNDKANDDRNRYVCTDASCIGLYSNCPRRCFDCFRSIRNNNGYGKSNFGCR